MEPVSRNVFKGRVIKITKNSLPHNCIPVCTTGQRFNLCGNLQIPHAATNALHQTLLFIIHQVINGKPDKFFAVPA